MVSKKVMVHNPSGLHARPAGMLAKAAGSCKSDVTIVYGEKRVAAKSILKIMSAAIKCGSEIEVQCNGENEEEDLKMLTELIESGLGE